MFTLNKWLLAGLVVIAGEIITMAPGMTQAFNHDTTSIPTNQSLVDNGVSTPGINGLLNPITGEFSTQGLGFGNGITISPDIIQAFMEANGIEAFGADGSDTVAVCLSDPCVGSGEGTSISLNDLAKLMQEDIEKSLSDLAEAEANQEPRRFARRRSTDCANTTAQLRKTIEDKLEASQRFVEQLKKMSPENSAW